MSRFRSCAGRLVSYDVNGVQYRRIDNGAILVGDGNEHVYVSVNGGGREPLKLTQDEFEEASNFNLTPKMYWNRRCTYPVFRNNQGTWCSGARGTRLNLSNRVKTAAYARRMAQELNKLTRTLGAGSELVWLKEHLSTQVGSDRDQVWLKACEEADSREKLKKVGVKNES